MEDWRDCVGLTHHKPEIHYWEPCPDNEGYGESIRRECEMYVALEKSRKRWDLIQRSIWVTLLCLFFLLIINSCAYRVQTGIALTEAEISELGLDTVAEPIIKEKRIKIGQYWNWDATDIGYYYEYKSGSKGVYKWYDTGEVILEIEE